jgi:hypothetical protein
VAGALGRDDDRGPDEGGYRIQAAGEHGRDPANQDVADRAAADGGDGPEDDSLPRTNEMGTAAEITRNSAYRQNIAAIMGAGRTLSEGTAISPRSSGC